MIVSRVQLYCDGDHGIPIFWHEDGAIDGALLTHAEVRREAKRAGWGRADDGAKLCDLCPDCLRDHKLSMRRLLRKAK